MKISIASAFGTLALVAAVPGQVIVKVDDNVNFRFGMYLQGWADWTQDANSKGYSENMFLRRVRFILLATVAKNVSILYLTDNPRVGNAGTSGSKTINTGFITQDALVEWKAAGDSLMLDAGLFIVPSSRNALTRASNFMAFDIGTWALQGITLEQNNGARDYGVGLHGYVGGDRLEYRLAAFDGHREGTTTQAGPLGPEAGSRNSFRIAGRLNYDFFDPEHGENLVSKYVYAGTNLGAKKVLAIGAWGDGQGAYKAYGADFMFDWPIARDAVTVTGDYEHFEQNVMNPTLPKQNDLYSDAGYYLDVLKLQPFVVYQRLNFSDEIRKGGNTRRYGSGLNWYISGNSLKLSFLYERIVPATKPATARIKDTNRVAVQLQAYYF